MQAFDERHIYIAACFTTILSSLLFMKAGTQIMAFIIYISLCSPRLLHSHYILVFSFARLPYSAKGPTENA